MTAMLYGQDRVAARIVLFSVITCVGMGATACVIFDGRRQIRTRGVALYLLLSILGLAALHLLRVLVYGLGWEAPGSMLHPTPWALFFIVGGSVTVPALFLALLLLVQTRMSERMQEALTFDSLTQAYSRRSFMDELQHELRRCERNDGRLVVLLLDIDFFKAINDRHGHATGDQALRHFARVVQRAVRASDRFGRLGGEEFALLMYDCEPASALVQAQRVCDALRDAPLHTVDGEIRMTVSGGGAYRRGDTADGILARADVALYRAKELGRDRVETGGSVGFGAAATWDWTAQGGAEAANAAVAASPRDRRRLRRGAGAGTSPWPRRTRTCSRRCGSRGPRCPDHVLHVDAARLQRLDHLVAFVLVDARILAPWATNNGVLMRSACSAGEVAARRSLSRTGSPTMSCILASIGFQ